jgi:hypothetical protein
LGHESILNTALKRFPKYFHYLYSTCSYNQYTIQKMHPAIHHLWRVNSKMFQHCGNTFRELLYQRYISHRAKICSAPHYKNDYNIKMLKYVQLIQYSIVILDIKICNNQQPQLPVIDFLYISSMYTNIGHDTVWSEKISFRRVLWSVR